MGKKLKCVAAYRNDPRGLIYQPGELFEVDDEAFAFLMADAPGCFKMARAPKNKAVKSPPADK